MTTLADDFDASSLFSDPVQPDSAATKAKKQEKEQAASKMMKEKAKVQKEIEKTAKAEEKKAEAEAEKLSPSEHQRLKQMVLRYRNSDRFGPYLEENGFKSLTPARVEKMKAKELKNTYDQIQACLGTRGTEDLVKNLAIRGISIGELAMAKTPYPVPGLSRSLEKDEKFMALLEEAQIQYLSLGVIDLRVRIALYIAMRGVECNRAAAHRAVEKTVASKKDKEGVFSEEVKPDAAGDPKTFL